ncbi:hypothetical protein [Paracidovorax sp. MALMAid1276]|uniref:hypothetical protein n=1 Tax=Paracidovorax sp. MALMAid1276 TaxID=3411631 RepID=UPI003B9C8338
MVKPLVSLHRYTAPSMPTEHTVRRAWKRVRRRLLGSGGAPVLQQEALERASLACMDALALPPAGLLHRAIDDELREWLRQPSPDRWQRVLVMPPCDQPGVVEAWARAAGHTVLIPPALRAGTPGPDVHTLNEAEDLAALDGSGLVVIPRLEHWFLRHRDGLHRVRRLLAQLAAQERRCLIACNSWAWRYLVKAVGADVLLPRPQTLAPFDAELLKDWFGQHTTDDDGQNVTFRLVSTGEDVLATDKRGALASSHLQQLAARSIGIPWVAGALWRASLRVRTASDGLPERALSATADDVRTVWVADVEDPRIPRHHEDQALLVLQALLLHEALSATDLASVLPANGEADVLPALLAAGFVAQDGQLYRICPAAYPGVRGALQAAGFPLGEM